MPKLAGRPFLACAPIALSLLATACTGVAPEAPSLELYDETQRLDAKLVNAHTYGTFVIVVEGGSSAIQSGPANFPGNPPGGPGTCEDGLWINSKGKRTAGTVDHPHPHCTSLVSGLQVVLEPISSQVRDPRVGCLEGGPCDFLLFGEVGDRSDLNVEGMSGIKGAPGSTKGDGLVTGYAIDASTLHGANVRVGTITFDLSQYAAPENLFGLCDMGTESVECLSRVITGTYKPFGEAFGTFQTVTGFLWWSPATAPYNY